MQKEIEGEAKKKYYNCLSIYYILYKYNILTHNKFHNGRTLHAGCVPHGHYLLVHQGYALADQRLLSQRNST